MKVEYRTVELSTAINENYAGLPDWIDEGDADDGDCAIYRFENDVPVECLALDGGEPEDNSFSRDGSWIAGALEAAYKLGQANPSPRVTQFAP